MFNIKNRHVIPFFFSKIPQNDRRSVSGGTYKDMKDNVLAASLLNQISWSYLGGLSLIAGGRGSCPTAGTSGPQLALTPP